MNRFAIAGILLMLAGQSACSVPPLALDPWLSAGSGADDVSLAGKWKSDDGCADFVRSAQDQFIYAVRVTECGAGGGESMQFAVSVHRVDGQLLMNVGPQVPPDGLPLMLPVHLLVKIELEGESMRLFSIDTKSFNGRAASANIALRDSLVLGTTDELSQFVAWQVGDFSFFADEPSFSFRKLEED